MSTRGARARGHVSTVLLRCLDIYPIDEGGSRGGGISWPLNFAWEISRFKLTAKFTLLREFLAHQQYTLWTLAGGTTQNPGGSAKFFAAKFITANLTWHEPPPPPLSGCVTANCWSSMAQCCSLRTDCHRWPSRSMPGSSRGPCGIRPAAGDCARGGGSGELDHGGAV